MSIFFSFLSFMCPLQIVVEADQNHGALESWRKAWSWRDNELFVILEDDNEVSDYNEYNSNPL